MTLCYDVLETSLGWMGILASPAGIRRTTLPQQSPEECVILLGNDAEEASWSPEHFEELKSRLSLYFEGTPVTFEKEPIDVDDASSFLKTAWRACRTIPFGETRSYSWLAEQAGNPRAARAAGQCMARNRLAIIIPCHRVLASGGGLGGFGKDASQLDLKQALLDLEASARK